MHDLMRYLKLLVTNMLHNSLCDTEYLTLEAAQSAADRSQYTSNIDSHDENDDESIVHLKHKKKSAIHTSSNKPGNKLLKKREWNHLMTFQCLIY
jgi:hypothetical protein